MKDSVCKCFTGRISRLINILNGFDDNIVMHISDNEQIGNIIILTKEQLGIYYDVEQHIQLVKNELQSRGYTDDVINEWISHIE